MYICRLILIYLVIVIEGKKFREDSVKKFIYLGGGWDKIRLWKN